MKLLTISLLAATVAVLGSLSARADDQQSANRLAIQRAQASTATVAVFSGHQGLGSAAQATTPDKQIVRLSNGHGQVTQLFR
jgi:hypothetical protein